MNYSLLSPGGGIVSPKMIETIDATMRIIKVLSLRVSNKNLQKGVGSFTGITFAPKKILFCSIAWKIKKQGYQKQYCEYSSSKIFQNLKH